MQLKLSKADWIVIVAFILMIINHSITIFLISTNTTPQETQEQVTALVRYVEGNPIAAFALQFRKASNIYSYILVPAFYGGIYYYMRKKHQDNQDMLELFAITLFLGLLINFFNDVTYLLAWLASGG